MTKFKSNDRSKAQSRVKGFTLIELLIVIALLGALAVGLLAALDPFEQLKKGTDTGIRNTLSEFHGATIRFFALKNHMPWCDFSASPVTCNDPTAVTLETLNSATYENALDQIITAGELKADFETLAANQLDKIYVSGTDDPPLVKICYQPTSKSFKN
ncbi:MAG: hypothetical protein UZ21_OP11001000906 [Microgenomates bacterium OLB22]|nr:MAG: hypothetical protein UZ21_OP11001000906 [Microgenomates bacterium OLB22]